MADGDREYIGGWLAVEHTGMHWSIGITDPDVKIVLCGEIGNVRWLLFLAAWREACRRDLELALQAMAERVGIEYSPIERRREAPHSDQQPRNTGGNP